MPRPFWKGSISFGLVEIPVSLHPATESHDLSLTMLDRKDFSPVGYRRYNKNTGEEVPWERIVRGYEYDPDEYVVLGDEDLKRANVEATQTIEIVAFVDRRAIDPVYFATPYYVEPLKRGSKSYALLRDALERSGKIGIAKVVLRTRQHLAALLVRDDVLVLELLRYPYEIRKPDELAVPARNAKQTGVSAKELAMAQQLIDGMSDEWKPESYRDDYHDDLMALIERRVREGKTHTIEEPEAPARRKAAREVVDLMPLLKQSLARHVGERARARPASRGRSGSDRAARVDGRARRGGSERLGRSGRTRGAPTARPERRRSRSA